MSLSCFLLNIEGRESVIYIFTTEKQMNLGHQVPLESSRSLASYSQFRELNFGLNVEDGSFAFAQCFSQSSRFQVLQDSVACCLKMTVFGIFCFAWILSWMVWQIFGKKRILPNTLPGNAKLISP